MALCVLRKFRCPRFSSDMQSLWSPLLACLPLPPKSLEDYVSPRHFASALPLLFVLPPSPSISGDIKTSKSPQTMFRCQSIFPRGLAHWVDWNSGMERQHSLPYQKCCVIGSASLLFATQNCSFNPKTWWKTTPRLQCAALMAHAWETQYSRLCYSLLLSFFGPNSYPGDKWSFAI